MSMCMYTERIEEAGYTAAMSGLALYRGQPLDKMHDLAVRLSGKDGGHNKFLEHMYVWLEVTAPRYWWQEADTYRMASKQSEGTMYNFKKRPIEQEDFEEELDEMTLARLNFLRDQKDYVILKANLPEGYLQTRLWCMSYKTLRNIILQRWNHELPHWRKFCEEAISKVSFPEFLPRS